jgi:ABC-type multidrug transport system ATPase subunit
MKEINSMFEVHDVFKKYPQSKHPALNGLSFSSANYDPIGILGSNGAGKTTLFMLSNILLSMDKGDIIVNGFSVNRSPNEIKNCTGLFTDKLVLYPSLTVKESIRYFMGIYGVNKKNYDYWSELFKIKEYENKKIKQLSTGMLKKILLLISIIPNPKVLFLDEPFSGLDPLAKREFIEILKHLNESQKMKLIVSSHDLTETQSLVKEVVIIEKGQVIENGTISDLVKKYNGIKTVEIKIPYNSFNFEYFKGSADIEQYDMIIKIKTDIAAFNRYISEVGGNAQIYDIDAKDISLDDLYNEVKKNAAKLITD